MPPTSSARVSTSMIAASTSERSSGVRALGSMSGRNIPGGRGCRRIRLFPEDLVGAALDRETAPTRRNEPGRPYVAPDVWNADNATKALTRSRNGGTKVLDIDGSFDLHV